MNFSSEEQTRTSRILDFMEHVEYNEQLPQGIKLMNPYREHVEIQQICQKFYKKYYEDHMPRRLILGINPGRLGAGATGIPFTDTKRLKEVCGISTENMTTHEPSSVFIYDVISAWGGPESFYKSFYINSVCPLGFIIQKGNKFVNYNYYDDAVLERHMRSFIIWNIFKQIEISGTGDICFCLGTGKNYHYLKKLNETHMFFNEIIPLEHPRYIMQYRSTQKEQYIQDYLVKLKQFSL
jgi:hypothetical protein